MAFCLLVVLNSVVRGIQPPCVQSSWNPPCNGQHQRLTASEAFPGSGYYDDYTWLSGDRVNDDGKGHRCSKIGGTRNLT